MAPAICLRSSALCKNSAPKPSAPSAPSKSPTPKAVVLPGVGHFSAFVAGLHERNLTCLAPPGPRLRRPHSRHLPRPAGHVRIERRSSRRSGLGFFPGEVRVLPTNVKAPHIGWNQVERRQPSQSAHAAFPRTLTFISRTPTPRPASAAETAAVCNHGVPFAAVIEQKNLRGRAIPSGKIRRDRRARAAKFSGVGASARAMT